MEEKYWKFTNTNLENVAKHEIQNNPLEMDRILRGANSAANSDKGNVKQVDYLWPSHC